AVVSDLYRRTILELDDGRPLFLFVQSYRAHAPYEVSPETLAAHPELFGEDPRPEDWDFGALVSSPEAAAIEVSSTLLRDFPELRDTMRRMYLGGVADLDLGFRDLLDLLEQHGLGDAALVLTSDHGEAFGEHAGWAHGNSAFEEQLAVPMVLRAPGVPAGMRPGPVGLVDLPTTLARLAGLEPDPAWVGRDMLDPELSAPLLAFEIEGTPRFFVSDDLALYAGDRKVILQLVDGELVLEPVHAFDLASDPAELASLDEPSRAWAKQLLERYRSELEDALRRRAPIVRLELTEQELSELAAMGYLGD
ncbi:MAG: sulfatase-like hydrolase/transferase, partial [Planctomycetota bacterium]|nr:sulfatase-like hydrolase/transferase [Planctomycetota bacterium]